ncbi:Crp/Fnr family transcriptional regulator [Ramlibacter tataouinensis]|uniref:Crp/Fnr family transcriptional regulator n=1 Tax=Ramlibacter tataouinensis TaxID=94132 RepID=UPI0022F39B11|nr:Crp/Fnr family transcriptional regulator [Ramlibacter tataouinensis]WBY02532.1 Crp/Fnr family transcriptional regulator [Ramlibacter tataouinensis]
MQTSSPPGHPPDIVALYPALANVLSGQGLPAGAALLTVPAGTTMFNEQEPCKGFPLVLQGEVRVARRSGDGREMELYRVGPGELCLVSSTCLFRSQPLMAHGVATRPTTVLLVEAPTFRRWLDEPVFRDSVLGLFAQRMADLTALVDAIAFHKLDRRLAAALLGHGQELAVTHQALADRLGTVREIVTRLLRRFEREGWIEGARERIRILDSAALRRQAQGL